MNTKQRHNHPNMRTSSKRSLLRVLALGLLTLTSTTLLQAQDLPFSSGSTGADGPLIIPEHPTYRRGATLGYDEVNEQLVLFGGYWSSTYFTETWVTSDPSLGWTKLEPATFLSGRQHAAMAWDYSNDQLVLFGGYRADGMRMDDMWSWDGTNWTQIVVDTPPARYWHSLVSDPVSEKMWVIGGRAADNTQLQDVWEWDGTEWTQLVTSGVDAFHNYNYERAVFDPSDSSIIQYSSYNGNAFRLSGDVWTEIATSSNPGTGTGFSFVYDPVLEAPILFGGSSHHGKTWKLENDDWVEISTSQTPERRYDHAAAYDGKNDQVTIVSGWMDNTSSALGNVPNYNTWSFSNNDWTEESGRINRIDMSTRESGIWNYTTIEVPANAEIQFLKNISNTPVVWLATGDVNIDGSIQVDGENGYANDGSDTYAQGGPGGSAGGLGAIRRDVSGNYAGTPGQGAGGGAPGVTSGQYGTAGMYRNTYGNSLLLPLVGGSAGGGGASTDTANGGHGGGGGGAILIASDLNITVNGYIDADGGNYAYGGGSYGGRGSGGGIKLMADRVLGSGVLRARGGRSQSNDEGGRIRIEAFFRPLTANATPPAVATAPIAAPDFGDLPTLSVTSVDGENVAVPATGNLQTPDVVFTEAGVVSIVVDSENIPEGTPVTLRITTSGEIILLPANDDPDVTIDANGQATFEATVPAGLGTIQAFSEFTPE